MASVYRWKTLIFVLVLAIQGNAWSQAKPVSKEREALRRVQQQLQQLREEKAAADSKATGLEQESKVLKEERARLAAQAGRAQALAKVETAKAQQLLEAVDVATKEQLAIKSEFEALRIQKAEVEKRLGAQIADISAKLAVSEQELARLADKNGQTQSLLVGREKQLASCEGGKTSLYQHGRDLIEFCRDATSTHRALRTEPFTGIKRVEIENQLEIFRDKLEIQRTVSANR